MGAGGLGAGEGKRAGDWGRKEGWGRRAGGLEREGMRAVGGRMGAGRERWKRAGRGAIRGRWSSEQVRILSEPKFPPTHKIHPQPPFSFSIPLSDKDRIQTLMGHNPTQIHMGLTKGCPLGASL